MAQQQTTERQGVRPSMLNADAIDDIFNYHAPEPDQIPRYEAIRAGAKAFAHILLENGVPSADLTVAIRKLRECVHIANGSVALKGRY